MSRLEQFKQELELIKDKHLHSFAKQCLEALPEYFFSMPASTSAKYHPEYTLGYGGLVNHTRAAVKIAQDLLGIEMYEFLHGYKDLIIFALIFHDGIKKGHGGGQWTVTEHPLHAVVFITDQSLSFIPTIADNGEEEIFKDKIVKIGELISSHMGQWNTDYRTKKEVLPKPKTPAQKFVHMCDYLASRKYLICELDG